MITTPLGNVFQDIFETIREPVLLLDPDLKVVLANKSFIDSFEVKKEEALHNFIYDLGNGQWDIPRLRKLLEEILPKNNSFENYEIEHEVPGIGHKIMLLNARRLIAKETGDPMILISIEDITERKQMETLLKDSEDRYRRLFETANDGILLLEKRELQIRQANPAITAMLGYSKEECVGKHMVNIGFPDNVGNFQETMQTLNKDGIIHYKDVAVQKKTGQVIDADIYMVDKASLVQCNVRDITERKHSEAARRENEQQFETMFEVASIGMAHADPKTGQWLRVNRKMCEITGYSPAEMLAMRVPEITHPEDRERDWEAFQNVISGKWKNYRLEKRYIRKDNTIVWVNVNMTVIRDLSGQPTRTMATIEDITERKFQENERELRARLIMLLTAPDDFREHMSDLTASLQNWSGCEAVGIRLRAGDDYPYYETRGFPPTFVQEEKHLCAADSIPPSRSSPPMEVSGPTTPPPCLPAPPKPTARRARATGAMAKGMNRWR